MVDPVTAFSVATAAFGAIKKGFEIGRDVESMYGDIGRWMSATETVTKEANKATKNGMSVEEEALEIFAQKKKIQAMENELRTFINLSHGPDAWNQVLMIQADIRKKRKEAILKAQEKQQEIIAYTVLAFAVGCTLWDICYILIKVYSG